LLLVVCLLVLVEALAFVGLGVAWLVDLVRNGAELPGAVVFLVVFCLAVAALLGFCARGLWNHRRWARSPVITWQVFLVVLALGWLGVEVSVWGVAVVVVALVVGIGLLLPSVVAVTARTAATDGPEPR
jgi:ABC-type multidrug transport system permease subunit